MTFSEPDLFGIARNPLRYESQDSLDAYEGARALRMDVADAIACLPERQQIVLALYFQEQLKMREIGEVLGMTEFRVSRLHASALIAVKAAVGAWAGS